MARDAILYSDRLREYDLGHVLTGERYERFMTLYRRRLGDDFDGRQFQGPGPAPGRLVCARIGRTVLSGSPGRLRPGRDGFRRLGPQDGSRRLRDVPIGRNPHPSGTLRLPRPCRRGRPTPRRNPENGKKRDRHPCLPPSQSQVDFVRAADSAHGASCPGFLYSLPLPRALRDKKNDQRFGAGAFCGNEHLFLKLRQPHSHRNDVSRFLKVAKSPIFGGEADAHFPPHSGEMPQFPS